MSGAYTPFLPTDTIESTEGFLRCMGSDDYVLVSELDGKIVGMAWIHFLKSSRKRHSAFLGMVRIEYQGQGIGKNLMENILDLIDNWLMLVRIELDVTVDNEKAISLYQSFGFEIEETKKICNNKGWEVCRSSYDYQA
jgi:L-phenylalanine/L-methionine N-acetyltransferase